MKVMETGLKDAFILEPAVFGDQRGWFMETFNESVLLQQGIQIPHFVQDNHSYSSQKGTIRGLHCQLNPHCQTKLIRCTKGQLLDVIVDVRVGSPTYKQWIKVLLSAENKKQLLIPKGFLHGFLSLTDDVEIQYKVDSYYDKSSDRSIIFNDDELNIDWGIEHPILSEKDRTAPKLRESDVIFYYEK